MKDDKASNPPCILLISLEIDNELAANADIIEMMQQRNQVNVSQNLSEIPRINQYIWTKSDLKFSLV